MATSSFAGALVAAALLATVASQPAFSQASASAERDRFRWPLRGQVVQPYAPGENDGLDIKAPVGEAVHAAADGDCLFAGELKPFGQLVLIRHPHGYVTAYGYLSDLLVKQGDKVKRGEIIGKSGDGGGSPRLHFELRKDSEPIDPTKYLVPL